jgi:tetratricopeptide (TPR) repeat protein
LGLVTYARNVDYKDGVTIWQDNILKTPNNTRAYTNLARHLIDLERWDEATAYLTQALELYPNNYEAHLNLGLVLEKTKRFDEANPTSPNA